MKTGLKILTLAASLALIPTISTQAQNASRPSRDPVPVTADNFVRAESDRFFAVTVSEGGFGKFEHKRDLMSVHRQTVAYANLDTVYSKAVFDLDAGPVTITLPDPGKRFMSMQVINEDHYTQTVIYTPGNHTFTKDQIGTRYVLMSIRFLVEPTKHGDVEELCALQDAIKVEQKGAGRFEVPTWDQTTLTRVRDALLVLAATLPDRNRMFGAKYEVEPVRRLIGAAAGWGGNPQTDATYLTITPDKNDGDTVYRLTVKDVPVDGFWSISVYNAGGYFQPNEQNAYTVNGLTAKRSNDGSVVVQFGGYDGKTANCLPIVKNWNYIVRLYRPRKEIIDGTWKFPEAKPVK